MSSWSHGYNVEQGYTFSVFRELSPDWLDFTAQLTNYLTPERTAGFRYLEFGSGQGLGLCVLAACYPEGEFVGIDFNPEHIRHSTDLAHALGLSNIRFVEADFADLALEWPAWLGTFQYVVLHGIYSWIPLPVRHALVQCLEKATEPGALVYASYNSMPGWAASIPLQHMLRRMQVTTGGSGVNAIRSGVQFFEELQAANAGVSRAYPTLKTRLEMARTQNPAYLVQEYLHDNWHPLWFSQVANEMGAAKLKFAASASLPDNYLPASLSEPLRKAIHGISDPDLKIEAIDCAVNQTFRKDVFTRGARQRFDKTAGVALDQSLMLIRMPQDGRLTIKTNFGEVAVSPEMQAVIAGALQAGPRKIRELLAEPGLKAVGSAFVLQTLVVLIQGGFLSLARDRVSVSGEAFNAVLAAEVATSGAPYTYLIAPRIGTAIAAKDVDLMILADYLQHRKVEVPILVQGLSATFTRLGRSVVKDGKVVTLADEQAQLLRRFVEEFVTKLLPAWRACGVID